MSAADRFFDGKISIREFLVDFFGALMPGIFFLIFITFCFLIPAIALVSSLQCLWGNCEIISRMIPDKSFIDLLGKIPVVFDITIFLLFLTFAYVAGTFFYRQDPKVPDYRSFITIARNFPTESDLINWVVKVRAKNVDGKIEYISNPKAISKFTVQTTDVEFPYNNLKGYMAHRGWSELSKLIKWEVEDKDSNQNIATINPQSRSKTFINALKIRLQFYCPEHCSTIIKNEAHIRLSSSMWYVSNSVFYYAIIGVGFIILSAGIFILKQKINFANSENLFCFCLLLSVNLGIIASSRLMRFGIEKFFHYQRVREIFYVLETAASAVKFIEYKDSHKGAELIFGGIFDEISTITP